MILIVDCGSSKVPYIEQMIDEYSDFKTILFFDLTLEMAQDASGIIFSGAPILITEIDIEKFTNHVSWIKDYEKPILGICFGHQLLGLVYGAFGSRMKEDRDWQEIENYNDSPLLDKFPPVFEMMEDHCESISVPPGFELIASSDACVNEMMQHKKNPFFGVQFHPEVSGNHGSLLFENFVKLAIEKK